jgi:hypothetical protein
MTAAWGPSFWAVLHLASFGVPDDAPLQKRRDAHAFFTSVGPMLPCDQCRRHYAEHLAQQPIGTQSVSRWLVDLHNRVNAALGKESVTYESVAAQYRDFEAYAATSVLPSSPESRYGTFAPLYDTRQARSAVSPSLLSGIVVGLAVAALVGAWLVATRRIRLPRARRR